MSYIPTRGTLKFVGYQGQTDANGDLTFQLKVPGTTGQKTRLIKRGEAWFKTPGFGDHIAQVLVRDVDNILGYGAGAVLETYHENEMAASYQKNFIFPTQKAFIESAFEAGELVAGLYLEITVKKVSAPLIDDFYCNIYWARKD